MSWNLRNGCRKPFCGSKPLRWLRHYNFSLPLILTLNEPVEKSEDVCNLFLCNFTLASELNLRNEVDVASVVDGTNIPLRVSSLYRNSSILTSCFFTSLFTPFVTSLLLIELFGKLGLRLVADFRSSLL